MMSVNGDHSSQWRWRPRFGFSNMEVVGDMEKPRFGGVAEFKPHLELASVRRGEEKAVFQGVLLYNGRKQAKKNGRAFRRKR